MAGGEQEDGAFRIWARTGGVDGGKKDGEDCLWGLIRARRLVLLGGEGLCVCVDVCGCVLTTTKIR
jgi:hypothetical protein